LEWPVAIPINMTGRPYTEAEVIQDRQLNAFSTRVLGVEAAGYAALKQANDAEDARERVRLWYVAATRARGSCRATAPSFQTNPGRRSSIFSWKSSLAYIRPNLARRKSPPPTEVKIGRRVRSSRKSRRRSHGQ
jgi:ATP-dependent exoDNAse (exonuclease V) beta subunit